VTTIATRFECDSNSGSIEKVSGGLLLVAKVICQRMILLLALASSLTADTKPAQVSAHSSMPADDTMTPAPHAPTEESNASSFEASADFTASRIPDPEVPTTKPEVRTKSQEVPSAVVSEPSSARGPEPTSPAGERTKSPDTISPTVVTLLVISAMVVVAILIVCYLRRRARKAGNRQREDTVDGHGDELLLGSGDSF
jgi:hypothetical protein